MVGKPYRSWSELRDIVRSTIAESNPPTLESFRLSDSEKTFFRLRSERMLSAVVRETSEFKSYYALPVIKPFRTVILISGATVAAALGAAAFFLYKIPTGGEWGPIVGPTVAVIVAAVGWAVSSGLTHRNTIRQSTNNMLFARFSQATFGDAMHRFFTAFSTEERITSRRLEDLKTTGEEGRKAAASVSYLLNYFEFIASGVLKGDLDDKIVRDNIRGNVIFYYDKCEPHILALNRKNVKIFEFLIKLRTHYREP
jgi:hypothetical protein